MKNYSQSERERVCDLYEKWFEEKLNAKPDKDNPDVDNSAFLIELATLKNIYRKHGKLNLFCHCYPRRCHAETIKRYMMNSENYLENSFKAVKI
jgi:hypothetical protein